MIPAFPRRLARRQEVATLRPIQGDRARAAHPVFIWLAAAIGIFWATRSLMQWTHYSASHRRGDALRTAIHWLLFFGYGGIAAVYFFAAFAGKM